MKRKGVTVRQVIHVAYSVLPYFAVSADIPDLSGIRGVGETPQVALTNLRAEIRRRYPAHEYDIEEHMPEELH